MTISKLEHNAAALKRWRTRLKRAMTIIDKLEKQRRRLEAKKPIEQPPLAPRPNLIDPPEPVSARPARTPPDRTPAEKPNPISGPVPAAPVALAPRADDLAIPTFLQRRKLDPVAKQIAAEQEATKKAKARGRIDKMKAKKSGETRKMPLTGKAALAAIRG